MAGRGVVSNASNADHGHIHGPESVPPASVPSVTPATTKKGKNKKAPDAKEVEKALAAKINQLELDAAGEKDQELEIGGFSSNTGAHESILDCMKDLDLPHDMIAQAMRLLSPDHGSKTILQGGPSTPENMEPLLADLAGVSDLLSAMPNLFNAAQHKLTAMPPGLVTTLEREVKKATRDLTNLLNQMDNPLSKLETLQKKYSELLSDMRRLDRDNAKNKKRADLYQKEKDQSRSQLTKTDAVKAKLESVCRELQKENKKLKDEQKRIESDERSAREDLSDRVDNLFWELDEGLVRQETMPLQQPQPIESDDHFRQKFRSFIEQYELRELHMLSMLKTKDSEAHRNLANFDQEKKKADLNANKVKSLDAQVSTFSTTENELRSQLNIYVEKFKQFKQVEDTLNNSNDLFLTFRKEMEEMSKKTKRLEKENLNLTRKHDLTNRNILEMAEERTKVNKDMENLRKRNTTLESLVRRMQDQGRSAGAGAPIVADDEGTESDYDEEEYEEDGSEEEGDYDEETEDEALHGDINHAQPTYGPQPPSNPAATATATAAVPAPQARAINGTSAHRGLNGEVNGVRPAAVK